MRLFSQTAVNWFEIAVLHMPRAKRFYETIFGMSFGDIQSLSGMEWVAFPIDLSSQGTGGSLVKSALHQPSMHGNLLYLNANPDLNDVLQHIEDAGGRILLPKTFISEEMGFMAFFIDSEGNRMGLRSKL
jgi:predicted enzyme related to lactoylglutathione lyase